MRKARATGSCEVSIRECNLRKLPLTWFQMELDRISIDPRVMSGRPCIRGLRITVANVLRQLANHRSPEQILADYPYLEAADIDACLNYAAMRVDDEEVALAEG